MTAIVVIVALWVVGAVAVTWWASRWFCRIHDMEDRQREIWMASHPSAGPEERQP